MKRSDRISIPLILDIDNDNFSRLGTIISKSKMKNIVVFFGEGINNLFGQKIMESLNTKDINILKTFDYDDVNIESIVNIAFTIPKETEAIIGIGGGKVLDASKYICYLNHIPFISIPTSTSNDGFASSTCSLIINGKRRTIVAKVPYGIIVDIDVLKSAPVKFVYSGIGDLISKITAIYDWNYEQENGYTVIDDVAEMIAKKSVNSFVRVEFETFKDDFFLKELIDSLVMSGFASEIAQNSSPVSGSEHLISHALDRILDKPELHGIQVGIATYIMSIVQNHRSQRVLKVLKETGFFDYVKTLQMKKDDFENAIRLAPSIKPDRYTYLHNPQNIEKAIKVLCEDEILRNILF